jgi:hypothetical protein
VGTLRVPCGHKYRIRQVELRGFCPFPAQPACYGHFDAGLSTACTWGRRLLVIASPSVDMLTIAIAIAIEFVVPP